MDRFVSRYSDCHSSSARDVLRHCVLSGLSGYSMLTGQIRGMLRKPRVQFVYMHHVFDDQVAAFRRLIVSLSREHRFISYSDAAARIWNGHIDAPYLALSFDDGMKNHPEAIKILSDHGVSACFFVCPSIVGETNFERIGRFCTERLEMPPVEFMSWSDIDDLLEQGHEIGSHTLTHANLAHCSRHQLQDEIFGSFESLSRQIGEPKHFAWPYGRFSHFGVDPFALVFQAGFDSCASAERGCHGTACPDKPSLCIRRDHLIAGWPDHHAQYFLARNARDMTSSANEWPRALKAA